MCCQDHAFRHYVEKYLRAMPLGYRRYNEPAVAAVCAPLHSTFLTLKLLGAVTGSSRVRH